MMTLWLASIAAAWKVATMLASVSAELRELRDQVSEVRGTQVDRPSQHPGQLGQGDYERNHKP
jgi:hypothetical protein